MLTCIACSKQLERSDDDAGGGTPRTKEATKSLISQLKDMALKLSGAYRQCKPCTSSSSSSGYKKGRHQKPNADFGMASEGVHHPYLRIASSGVTPAWGFTNPNINTNTMSSMDRDDSRLKGITSGGRSPSSRSCDVVLVDEDEPKEWMAQVEPGVLITFFSLPHGGNDLKRIRFSREMFNKLQAQKWWGENYDRIMELYDVQRFSCQALPTPPRSEDERDPLSRLGSTRESPVTPPLNKERLPRNPYRTAGGGFLPEDLPETPHNYNSGTKFSDFGGGGGGGVAKTESSSVDASRTTTSSRDEASSDQEAEWVEQDEPGVFVTVTASSDGTRELRRVRFSRDRFGEVQAKLWWEENRERIQAQYL